MVTFTDADDRRQSYTARTNNSTGQTQSNAAPPTTNYGVPPDVSGYNATPPVITPPPQVNSPPVVDSEQVKIDYQTQQREQARLDAIQNLKSLYASTMSSPGPLGGANYEGLNLAKIFEDFGTDPTIGKDNSYLANYEDMPSKGQIPTTDWDKLNFLNHLGLGGTNVTGKQGLGSLFAIDSSGNAILDSSGNLIKTGLGNAMSDNFNEIVYGTPSTINPEKEFTMKEQFKNLSKDYWKSRDEQWHGSDYWDDYLGEYYGPSEKTDYSKMKRWDQRSLGEILQEGPTGFGDLQRIYGEELTDTSANPFAAVAAYNKKGSYTPSFGETITEYIA